eukprot:CAMPEP_0181068972 /NCGR_PEP_ID=MMETSP1070-20121207/26691_1 /TAXON_ID=265543 /ORGANISM="Minutocellus polymorphus, Strain NH13" /LENGTH=226 /DNA_ID=CAMNT_0023149733 /DNA_START=186 /DNA_END=867 /DNA_ORIENTATION=+
MSANAAAAADTLTRAMGDMGINDGVIGNSNADGPSQAGREITQTATAKNPPTHPPDPVRHDCHDRHDPARPNDRTSRPSRSRSSQRSVRFSSEVRCKPISYKTADEIRSVWMSSEERAELNGRTKKVVKRVRRRPGGMSEQELLTTQNESTRGVEHLLSAATLRSRQQEQTDVIDAVVVLQEHWRVHGRWPPDADRELAYTSHALSAAARDRARQFGRADAEEAAL